MSRQLTLPLPWETAMAEDSLPAAVDTVIAAWSVDGTMSEQTLDKFALLTRRFARFAAAHDVTTLDAADVDLVTKFVAAKGRTRHGAVGPAAVATMHNRRAALRAFFRTARSLSLTLDDPTTDIAVPDREASTVRPLHDDEAALVRLFSEHATPTRHAATTALLLAGAHTSELGYIRIGDIDITTHTAWAHGSTNASTPQVTTPERTTTAQNTCANTPKPRTATASMTAATAGAKTPNPSTTPSTAPSTVAASQRTRPPDNTAS